ncbi:c-type cytochrome biogenesis protein CcmI [Halomonas sp. BM-2019]|uniref:c-type cytochrome biogenesis protein CcmI n=1 Tax=Halomonas sp. BM-2019 TaxID=2811227 RepID=UPI001B3C35DC|nr:MAG: c-type cytochrome biogenesis protein CcmI [Halomonas sp. BM-2019]
MNGLFLLLALGLCLLALAFVMIPLWREPRGAGPDRREVLLAVHRDRVAELDQDLAAGTLSEARHARALADLERELLDSGALEAADAGGEGRGQRRLTQVAALASMALLPFMAVGTYLTVGYSEEVFAARAPAGQVMPPPELAEPSDEEMAREFTRLVEGLQVRLAQDPADLQGWVLLGRTLTFLDDFEAAGRAFGEALRHGGDRDPEVLVRYADVLAELEGSLAGEPAALIEQALAIDPEHAQGLWLAGTRAYQAEAFDEARAYWERLLAVLPADSPEAGVIRGNLTELSLR